MARGWRAAETTELGAWLLRSNDGFTQRANSTLPLGQPGIPIAEAIDTVQGWYAERGQPARFQLPVEGRRLLDAELGERGWEPSADVHVLTARLDLTDGTAADSDVTLAGRPDDDWLAVFREGSTDASASRATLVRHDLVTFAFVRDGARTVAIGRGTVDDGWLGVTAVEVVAEFRRQGLARAVMHALHAWGRDHGAVRSHLAVTSQNAAALGLYRSIGYRPHHDYRYRTEPLA
jgi:GNAT superfamily N-acetyltransferase